MRTILSRRLLGAVTAVAATAGFTVAAAAPAWAVAPTNDNFANAQAQTDSFTDSLNNTDATTEATEPLVPTCINPVESVNSTVWYGLTINAGTEVAVDTIGSDFDTVLVVYTGASLGALSEIACNDDGGGGGGSSILDFTASASTTYWIQASGYNDEVAGPATGDMDLNVVITPPGCTITGTAGNDTLNGGNGADVICGLGGNDTINGGNNNDTVYAGPGNDTVNGGNSDDTIYGGSGDDIMGGGNGADYLYGDAGNDTNYGETLLGSLLYLFDNGNDHIYGGPGNDDLDGQNGDDVLLDTSGTDNMSGNLGSDNINVQDGAGGDTANGGLGSDTCTADAGDTTTSC